MSGVARTWGKIQGIAASVLAFVPGMQGVAAIGQAQSAILLAVTAKKPAARGSTTNVLIGANMPIPYSMGRTFVGGNLVHDRGYGGEVNDVKNPYRSMVLVWSCAGPVESIESFQSDFTPIAFSGGEATGYYENFLWLDTQLGASPEGNALAGPFGAIPDWGAAYKLSGYAAGLITAKFDKKGKRYASGLPQFGAIGEWVKVYDPRLDSNYPGGSGPQRFDDEDTWEYSDNPGLHGIAYARGRYQNGKKIFGCGFREGAIHLAAWVEFANVCDANGWTLGGTIYEPGSKWDNLKRICAAGAAEPVWIGARVSVKFNAPRVGLDTITAADLADGEISIPAMKTWRARLNGLIPKYRSEEHKWEYVQSALVSVPDYVAEDRGEEKIEERQLDLVQDRDQAAQVVAYELVNARELGPIVIPCKPRMASYVPGEALYVDLPEDAGLDNQLCVIVGRRVDPGTGIVELTLESETTAKHAFALGLTGTAPPTPALTGGEELDDIVSDSSYRSTPHVVANEAEMLALEALEGEVAIRTDLSSTFIHNGGTTGTAADWTEALSPTGQPPHANLTALSGLSLVADRVIYANGAGTLALSTLTAFGRSLIDDADASAARTTLGLVVGTDVQAQDAQLAAVAGLTPAADQVIYWTGPAAAAMTGLTAFGRSLIDDADAAAARTTLGLGTAAVKSTGTSGNTVPLQDGANTWAEIQAFSKGLNATGPGATAKFTLVGAGARGVLSAVKTDDTAYAPMTFNALTDMQLKIGAAGFAVTTIMTVSATGIDVLGEARTDTLRVDVTPTAATPAPTHTFPINLNGTVYRVPCVI